MTNRDTFESLRDKAHNYLLRYESKQLFIDRIERDTLKSCGGSISQQRQRLGNDADYKSNCGARDAFMYAAHTYALMAALYKE